MSQADTYWFAEDIGWMMAMLWHSHRLVDCCRLCLCRGRWESPICLWKDLILSFHYGNLKKSFSFLRHLGSLCTPPSLSRSFWFALCDSMSVSLFVCLLDCVCSDMNTRQEVQHVCLVYAPFDLSQNIFLMPISSPPGFVCLFWNPLQMEISYCHHWLENSFSRHFIIHL